MRGFVSWMGAMAGALVVFHALGCWAAEPGLAAGQVHTYGAPMDERVFDMRSIGAAHLLAGTAQRIDGDFLFDKAWLTRLDGHGRMLWQKSFIGAWSDAFLSVQPTSHGAVAAGSTFYFPERRLDGWVVAFGHDGQPVWQQAFGGGGRDLFTSVSNTLDGVVLAGETDSFREGFRDAWVVRLAGDGSIQWQKTYGRDDGATGIREIRSVPDGFIVVGSTRALFPLGLSSDGWVAKLDPAGNLQWQMVLGNEADGESLGAVVPSEDGYLLIGGRSSAADFNEDGWAVMLDLAGNVLWQKTIGSEKRESFAAAASSGDGYVLAGRMEFDGWLVKLDGEGNLLWQRTYGGERTDTFSSVLATSGGLLAAGDTETFGVAESDIRHGFNVWLLSLDSQGDMAGCSLGMPGDASASSLEDVPGHFSPIVQDIDAAPLETRAVGMDTGASMTTECAGAGFKSLLLPPAWQKWKELLKRPGFPFRY
ncbi:hypothetical protein DESUT3_34030 [Desulfuromonas versatilis]|uniref:Uncharacterized protein n=1 Tax=Desulfuromonas versatilis TaxID=2802975 RepID=A0ABM8I0I2_9BACT|nr:PQQ-like beta-propeller repeat protein [Desulfuromonas versatilis]BCR06334.1 hypothetical protein DESUT3_34030 [Desulfuromonas versatilis]